MQSSSGLLIRLLKAYFHGHPPMLKCPYPATGDIQQEIMNIARSLYRILLMKPGNILRYGIRTISVNGSTWLISETNTPRLRRKKWLTRFWQQNLKLPTIRIQQDLQIWKGYLSGCLKKMFVMLT